MKKTVLVMIVLSLALGIPGIAKSNSDSFVVWQIGFPHGEVNPDVDPIVGSSEYPATGGFFWKVEYTIGTDDENEEINSPSIPGFLSPPPDNICDIDERDDCTYATVQIDIIFTLDCDYYEDDEFTLVYGRFGVEADDIFLDGDFLDRVSGTEGKYDRYDFSLGELKSGQPHTISIVLGEPEGVGHYIDYIQLVSTRECIVPVEPVEVDIKPGSCPNPLNVKSKGVLPVALLGTEDFDVGDVNITTLSLEGIFPIRYAFEDVATALAPLEEKEECYLDCNDLGPDGFEDLTLKFDRQEIVAAIVEEVEDGKCVVLQLTGNLMDGTPIEGEDVILILDKPNVEAKQEKKEKKEKK